MFYACHSLMCSSQPLRKNNVTPYTPFQFYLNLCYLLLQLNHVLSSRQWQWEGNSCLCALFAHCISSSILLISLWTTYLSTSLEVIINILFFCSLHLMSIMLSPFQILISPHQFKMFVLDFALFFRNVLLLLCVPRSYFQGQCKMDIWLKD